MGLETAAILGLTGVASAGLGLAAADVSASGAQAVNKKQIDASKELQEDAQQYNTEMYERQLADSRQNYQTQLADSRANYQMQRQDQERFYQKYLTAQGMSTQLQQAGINPGSYLGAGKGISQPASMPSVSSTELGTPSAPSSPLSSVGALQNPMAAYGAILPQIAGSIKDIAAAAQSSATAKRTETMLEHELHKIIAEIGGQEALNTQLQLENEITKAFGKKKAAAEIKELTQSAFLKSMLGKTEDAKKVLLEIQQKIANEDLTIRSQQALTIATLLQKQINFVDAQIDTEKAKQDDLKASANEHNAGAGLKNQQTSTEELTTKLTQINLDVNKATKSQRINTLLSDLRYRAELAHKSEVVAKIDRIKKEVLLGSYKGETKVNLKKWDAYVDWISHIIKALSPLSDDVINSSPSYSSTSNHSFSESY